jgi:hypothetical protein
MSHKVYYIGIRWEPAGPRVKAVEAMLDPLGDWVRFNDSTWFLSTSHSPTEVDGALQRILTHNATVLVIALDPKERFGWAPQWIWDWIDGQRRDPPETAAAILGAQPSPRLLGIRTASRADEAAEG